MLFSVQSIDYRDLHCHDDGDGDDEDGDEEDDNGEYDNSDEKSLGLRDCCPPVLIVWSSLVRQRFLSNNLLTCYTLIVVTSWENDQSFPAGAFSSFFFLPFSFIFCFFVTHFLSLPPLSLLGEVEISSRTLIPPFFFFFFFLPGSVHSGSASGDGCDRMFPDKLRVS